MRVLITTTGSAGDTNPFIAIGRALRSRGHDVLMVANSYAEGKIRAAGLSFEPFGRELNLSEIAGNPDMMHPVRGPRTVWRDLILPDIPAAIEAVEKTVHEFRPDVAVSHHIYFGTQWVCERAGIPCAQVALSPMMWFSRFDPSVMSPFEPQRVPLWYARLRRAIIRGVSRVFVDRPLNRIRRQFGMDPRRGQLFASSMGGTINLGLWSKHYRPPLPDDPPNGCICGFAMFDGDAELTRETKEFLDTGDPPIVFTLGSTAVHVAGDFYEHAIAACKALGRRGLLLIGPDGNRPSRRYASIHVSSFEPLSIVAPRGCATVVHGGVGTTAQAMLAGRPFVVVPFSHDQFDNAARVQRLGVSTSLRRGKLTAATMATALDTLLNDASTCDRAADLADRMRDEDGASVAARALETLANS